jgi:two-component system CheB/CheR fusion protein
VSSLNEELQTVNAELHSKLADLAQSHEDLSSTLDSLGIAAVFLNRQLRIIRYTTQACKLISLIPSDVGRPLGDIVHRLARTNLLREAAAVLRTQTAYDGEVQTVDKESFLLRIIPHLSQEKRPGGVVLTVVEITRFKKSLAAKK